MTKTPGCYSTRCDGVNRCFFPIEEMPEICRVTREAFDAFKEAYKKDL